MEKSNIFGIFKARHTNWGQSKYGVYKPFSKCLAFLASLSTMCGAKWDNSVNFRLYSYTDWVPCAMRTNSASFWTIKLSKEYLLRKSSIKCYQVITSLPCVLFVDSHHSNASPFNTKIARITCCSSLTSIALKSLSISFNQLSVSIGSFVSLKIGGSSFLNFSRALVGLVAPTWCCTILVKPQMALIITWRLAVPQVFDWPVLVFLLGEAISLSNTTRYHKYRF